MIHINLEVVDWFSPIFKVLFCYLCSIGNLQMPGCGDRTSDRPVTHSGHSLEQTVGKHLAVTRTSKGSRPERDEKNY